jgi:hypothetical protein
MQRIWFSSAFALVAALAGAGTVRAATRNAPAKLAEKAVMVNTTDMKWMAAPPIFPPGARMAVIQGDPNGATYTVRLKAGDGYRIPAHWHPKAENVTVISGTFHVGLGDKLDESKGTMITPGGFASMPAHVHHYAWFTGETEVQVHGIGPFQLTYVNPADTPAAARK